MDTEHLSPPEVYSRFSLIPNERNVNKLLIYLIGFSEGFFDGNLALYYLFKDDFELSPVKLTLISSIPLIPTMLRPLMGYLIDTVPLFGSRRKNYLIFNSLGQTLSYYILALTPTSLFFSATSYLLLSVAVAFCLTIAEAFVVQNSRDDKNTLSGYLGSRALSRLISSFLSGYLLEKYSKPTIFIGSAIFPLLITFYAFFMKEDRETIVYESHPLKELVKFLYNPIIFPVLVIMVIIAFFPWYDDALLYYTIDVLGFSPTYIGFMKFAIGFTLILVVVLYRLLFLEASLRKMLFWTVVALLFQSFLPLLFTTRFNLKIGIPDKFIATLTFCILEGNFELNMLAFMAFASKIAPKGIETSVLVCASTIKTAGGFFYRLPTSLIMYLFGLEAHNFDNLNAYILFCSFIFFVTIPFLFKVPTDEEIELFIANQEPLLNQQDEELVVE